MSKIVVKIINDDETEEQFGPVDVSVEDAENIAEIVRPYQEQKTAAEQAAAFEKAMEEVAERNAAAEAENERREALAASGVDPDAEDEVEGDE